MKKEEWLFTFEKEAANPISDIPQLVTKAASQFDLTKGLELSEKYVKSATTEQLASVVVQMFIMGKGEKAIYKALVKNKVQPEYATSLISKLKPAVDAYLSTPEKRRELSKKYRSGMLFGGVVAIIGVALCIAMAYYQNGSDVFKRVVVTLGIAAILAGLWTLGSGLIGWIKYNKGSK